MLEIGLLKILYLYQKTKTISELEQEGFISVDVKNPKTNENFCDSSYVTITNTGKGFTYKYDVNSGDCSK